MRWPAFGCRQANRRRTGTYAAWLTLSWVALGLGQGFRLGHGEPPDGVGPFPRLPGAVTKAPDWIGTEAPFDVARFFDAPPRERNVAPLYLDALFEFDPGMAICFPEGPERERRRQAAEDRVRRHVELDRAIRSDPVAVQPEQVDAVITMYESGFRKLAEAQRRDRCVFEPGLGSDAPLPHAHAARQVARIASLRVRRAVERGDFDAAIGDVEAVLRLVRDLGPRGAMIHHLFAAAITQVACLDLVKTILADPGLRVDHCDRLLKAFLNHEAGWRDDYVEGLRGEYVIGRIEIRKLLQRQASAAGPRSPADLARVVLDMNDFYRTLLELDGLPYAARLGKISALKNPQVADPWSRMLELLRPALLSFTQQSGRRVASVRATECLIVMRRWQLMHRGLPRALLVAAREAGLKAVPIDPYDGRPMRVAVVEGQSAVYSIGKDGRDDGGRKDSRYDTQPGDLIYRLPPLEQPRRTSPADARKGR